MIQNVTRLEHKIGDRVYHFLCDMQSPVGEVHDALCMFKSFAMAKMNEAHEAEKQHQEENKPE